MALPESHVHLVCNLRLRAADKRKGLQLALEPLYGQGIAGYVPKPKLWVRALGGRTPGELTCCKRAPYAR
ncbi:hypothetical protein SAMN05444321_2380 [Bradyrhizobium lablabi]|nr:hypothetical protein SAMN05444321_2380 [Bradyrhizobium lablabi]